MTAAKPSPSEQAAWREYQDAVRNVAPYAYVEVEEWAWARLQEKLAAAKRRRERRATKRAAA